MRCTSRKICYASKGEAEEALLYTRSKYHSNAGSGPVSIYLCPTCNYYHLTSKGEKSAILTPENNKKIKLEQEASWWIDKFKKK